MDVSETEDSVQTEQPHQALFLVLAYLPLFELLAVSQVCKTFKDAVSQDVLAWLNLIVEKPLNNRLSDHLLMKFASKANGWLRTLALINCVDITDDGLQRVIEKNLQISKLFIPGCTALTPNGVVRAVQTLDKHSHNLVFLKIRGIYHIKIEHLRELQSILQKNWRHHGMQQKNHSIFYHKLKDLTELGLKETIRAIDIDLCPRCNQPRMVFDCPEEKCEEKRRQGARECRGCYPCIPRCAGCGKCLHELEEPEAAACNCVDSFCLDCWLQLPKCSFCNKAYCKQHVGSWFPSSSGFVCYTCHQKYILNTED